MRVVMYCARLRDHPDMTVWDSISAALDAAHIMPCGVSCGGTHVVAWSEEGRTHAEIVDEHRRAHSRAKLFDMAYPHHRPFDDVPLVLWDRPPELNEPLRRPAMNDGELRRAQDEAVANAPDYFEPVG